MFHIRVWWPNGELTVEQIHEFDDLKLISKDLFCDLLHVVLAAGVHLLLLPPMVFLQQLGCSSWNDIMKQPYEGVFKVNQVNLNIQYLNSTWTFSWTLLELYTILRLEPYLNCNMKIHETSRWIWVTTNFPSDFWSHPFSRLGQALRSRCNEVALFDVSQGRWWDSFATEIPGA